MEGFKFVFIIPYLPYPYEKSGGALRTRSILDGLTRLGTVRVIYLNYTNLTTNKALAAFQKDFSASGGSLVSFEVLKNQGLALRILCFLSVALGLGTIVRYDQKIRPCRYHIKRLFPAYHSYDVVFRHLRPFFTAGVGKNNWRSRWVDSDDWEPFKVKTRIRVTRNWLNKLIFFLKYLFMSFLSRKMVSCCDYVSVASRADFRSLKSKNIFFLPNVMPKFASSFCIKKSPASSLSRLIAVADWNLPHNYEGMCWFLSNVWESFNLFKAGMELRIIGNRNQVLECVWKKSSGVTLLGKVEDLKKEYEKAKLVICPITWGGGTKLKTIEALYFGRVPAGPVAAFCGLENMKAVKKLSIVEDDPFLLSQNLRLLCNDHTKRWQKEKRMKNYCKKYFGRERFFNLIQVPYKNRLKAD